MSIIDCDEHNPETPTITRYATIRPAERGPLRQVLRFVELFPVCYARNAEVTLLLKSPLPSASDVHMGVVLHPQKRRDVSVMSTVQFGANALICLLERHTQDAIGTQREDKAAMVDPVHSGQILYLVARRLFVHVEIQEA